MPKSTGFWTIGGGSILVFISLMLLAGASSDRFEQNLFAAAVCTFSVGILTIALGIYLKARAYGQPIAAPEQARGKGGCERCEMEPPVIHCRVHHLHLCGSCLADHYDFCSCAYVPSTRKPTAKAAKAAAKSMAAKAR